jgi:hypothetical protein
LVGGLSLLALVLVAPGSTMAAGPSGAASCLGIEMAAISPPGTSDEEAGGTPQFVSEVKSFAGELGLRPGMLFAFIASLHEGGHEQCDEALE